MKEKNKNILVYICVISVFVAIFSLMFYTTSDDIGFGFEINDHQIIKGNNISFEYCVSQGIFHSDVTDATMSVYVTDYDWTIVNEKETEPFTFENGILGKEYDGFMIIPTYQLMEGRYRLVAELKYRLPNEEYKLQILSLKIIVY